MNEVEKLKQENAMLSLVLELAVDVVKNGDFEVLAYTRDFEGNTVYVDYAPFERDVNIVLPPKNDNEKAEILKAKKLLDIFLEQLGWVEE